MALGTYMQLINLPIVDQLVIDLRSSVDYSASTALTACSLPVASVLSHDEWHQQLLQVLIAHVEHWGLPDKFKAIIVLQYGREYDEPDVQHAQASFMAWLSQVVQAMQRDAFALVPLNEAAQHTDSGEPEEDYSVRSLRDLQRKLKHQCKGVLALPEGYAAFQARMPFFTGPPGTSTEHLTALPSCLHAQVSHRDVDRDYNYCRHRIPYSLL
jgi:hypothetical protein